MLSAFEWMCYGNVRRTVHVGNKWCGRKSSLVTAANKTEQQPVINSPNNPGGGSNGSKCQAARQNTHSVLDSPADTHCQHSGFMAFWLLLLFLFKIDLKIKKEEVWATVSAEGKKKANYLTSAQEMSIVSDMKKTPKVPKSTAACWPPQSSVENPEKKKKKVALVVFKPPSSSRCSSSSSSFHYSSSSSSSCCSSCSFPSSLHQAPSLFGFITVTE